MRLLPWCIMSWQKGMVMALLFMSVRSALTPAVMQRASILCGGYWSGLIVPRAVSISVVAFQPAM